jgi:Nucleotidyl transferase AbiEii toxin, Type IV TA system
MTGARQMGEVAEQPSLPEKVILIDESLTEAKVPHALGGALALAYYADPRATIDIDVNVFVPTERWEEVVNALTAIGVSANHLDPSALKRDGQCRLWWGDNAVDLFFAYDPIHKEMRKQSRRVPFGDVTVSILSPEHLAICKAMFDRRKDWIDIEQMLIAGDDLDISEIEKWLVQMVGDSDKRVERLRVLGATPHE